MEDKLVKFETAVLAKQKEFYELCLAYYHNGKFYDERLNQIKDSSNMTYCCNKHNTNIEHAAVPTQSLLQAWIREKHNIHIIVNPAYSCELHKKDHIGITGYFVHIFEWISGDSQSIKFPTYEEALEFGLVKALNLIQ
jgi:hypothetical protein